MASCYTVPERHYHEKDTTMRKTRSLHPDCEMMEDRLVMSTVPGNPTVSDFAIIDLAKAEAKACCPIVYGNPDFNHTGQPVVDQGFWCIQVPDRGIGQR